MGWVPNTATFSLQDVVNVTGGTSLTAAFANAQDRYFDSAYKGTKTSLMNFRNYGYDEVMIDRDDNYCADIYNSGSTWSTVRGAGSGSLNGADPYRIRTQNSAGTYIISRTFLGFDLSSLAGKSAVDLEYRHGLRAYSGAPSLKVVNGTQSSPVGTGDYDAFTFGDEIISASVNIISPNGSLSYYLNAVASSSELSTISSTYFGAMFKIALLEAYDNNDYAPSSGEDVKYELWKAGEVLANTITNPYLWIRYR